MKKKSNVFSIRLSKEQRLALNKLAMNARRNPSDYIRVLLIEQAERNGFISKGGPETYEVRYATG